MKDYVGRTDLHSGIDRQYLLHDCKQVTDNQDSNPIISPETRGAYIVLLIPGGQGAIDLDLEVRFFNPDTEQSVPLVTVPAIISAGVKVFCFYPENIPATGHIDYSVVVPLPRGWIVRVVHNNNNPLVYQTYVSLLL